MASIAQPMPERDEESGRFSEEYSTQSFIEAIKAESGMAGTGDVANRVGCAHDTAYKKLQQLEAAGLVSSRKIGNALLWSNLPEEENQ